MTPAPKNPSCRLSNLALDQRQQIDPVVIPTTGVLAARPRSVERQHPGMSMPGGSFPPRLVEPLAESGHLVVAIDPRDTGGSTRYDGPPIDLGAILAGDLAAAPYPYSDVATDALGVLDALDVESAVWVGHSMGVSAAASSPRFRPWLLTGWTALCTCRAFPVSGKDHHQSSSISSSATNPATAIRQSHGPSMSAGGRWVATSTRRPRQPMQRGWWTSSLGGAYRSRTSPPRWSGSLASRRSPPARPRRSSCSVIRTR